MYMRFIHTLIRSIACVHDVYLCLCTCVSVPMYLCLCTCVPVYLRTCVPVYLYTCLPCRVSSVEYTCTPCEVVYKCVHILLLATYVSTLASTHYWLIHLTQSPSHVPLVMCCCRRHGSQQNQGIHRALFHQGRVS